MFAVVGQGVGTKHRVGLGACRPGLRPRSLPYFHLGVLGASSSVLCFDSGRVPAVD